MSESGDRELEEIIHSSTAKAEALFPKREMGIKARLSVGFIGLVLTLNAVLGVINSYGISQARACQSSQSAQLTALRSNNQTAGSDWIDGVTNSIVSGKFNLTQLKALRKDYHDTVDKNNRAIDAVRSVKCQ